MAVITRSQIVPLLVEACPAYEADWKRFATEYTDDPERFLYVALVPFAQCLSRTLAAGDRATTARVFSLLERFITEGEPEVQEAAVVGIIKDLQNEHLHRGTSPDDYLPFLLPESQRWWGKVRSFWTNGRLLTED